MSATKCACLQCGLPVPSVQGLPTQPRCPRCGAQVPLPVRQGAASRSPRKPYPVAKPAPPESVVGQLAPVVPPRVVYEEPAADPQVTAASVQPLRLVLVIGGLALFLITGIGLAAYCFSAGARKPPETVAPTAAVAQPQPDVHAETADSSPPAPQPPEP